jgi:hypothetical protein
VKGFGNSLTSCVQAGHSTSYTEALRQAKKELLAHGRANVPDFIVFLTDGEANIGSVYSTTYPFNGPDDKNPCQTAIGLANGYKAAGVTIYTIGYDLGNNYCTRGGFCKAATGGGYTICGSVTACYHYRHASNEVPAITSNQTLLAIASPNKFYGKQDPGSLSAIFSAIATDIGSGTSRLVDDNF